MPLPKVIHPAVYAIHKSIKNSLPFLAGREFLLLSVFQKFHAEIVFPGHTLLRVLLSYLFSLPKCWHESSVPRAWADRSELIFSAQPNTLKRWQRAYYKTFSWFLLGLWADGRRSFPRTQLAFSIWVPESLLPPYSQNTHSSHRNPSNSKYIRAAQLMASLSAQPPRMSARQTGITGLDKPICPTARMSARETGITNHFSQKSRRQTKLSLGSSVRRLFMPVLYSGISIQCLNLQPSGMVSGSLSK